MLKECQKCSKTYYGHGNSVWCSKCHSLFKEEWRQRSLARKRIYAQSEKGKEHRKEMHRLKVYNIDKIQFDRLFNEQNGQCAICGKQLGMGRSIAIDHNHTTHKTRGILCVNCNQGIGHLKDDIAILKSAIKYLKR